MYFNTLGVTTLLSRDRQLAPSGECKKNITRDISRFQYTLLATYTLWVRVLVVHVHFVIT